ncbi:flagellar motor switch protein FliG [Lutibaculum baratangense]|uniref:Flagellar motor switch protein FliG n=1 Tax=Lutibaculum baratangense AMV1 TaxID=631454 RepID=V4R917_9HYPH|nr:flagellar motor switch protein FliG [Lutibaculum baratangense]ESR22691.1 Flagellar motor switch protein FliG [Lutibaculum baratangense AMV1]
MSQELATISTRLPAPTGSQELKGADRAAALLLALGPETGSLILKDLDEDEVRTVTIAMSKLGKVQAETIERLLAEFVLDMNKAGAVIGNDEAAERLLLQFLPEDRVQMIMEEIRGPAGRNMWEKLTKVPETVLANYLKNEYPQTIALILSKIRADHAARVLAILPPELGFEVINRMLRMESVQREIIEGLEQTLRSEFMSNIAKTQRHDPHERMAEIFNNFDRQTEARFLSTLEEHNRDSAERIKALMFTFEDLAQLDAAGIQTLLRGIERDKLAVAMKGANEKLKEFFFSNMSQRAAQMLREDMEVMGPVRLREVDEAQMAMVNLAKDLAAKGEIVIAKNNQEDELVY